MTLDVDALIRAAGRGDLAAVGALTGGLTEAERRNALPAVKKGVAGLRREGMWVNRNRNDATGLALLACTTGAAAVATHLNRWWSWGVPDELDVAGALLAREAPWLPELVARLADQPPPRWGSGQFPLIERLRTGLGLPRPRTPGYLHGIATQLGYPPNPRDAGPRPVPLAHRLRADDELRALVPLVLQLEDSSPLAFDTVPVQTPGARTWTSVPRPAEETWRGSVVQLCADGLLDRDETADICLRMLLRGGTPAQSAFHLALLVDLDLDVSEVVDRQRSFLQLLGEGSGPVVKHAQKSLRAADDAGLLETGLVREASALVLARPDKGSATAQLGWLERHARRPGEVDDVLLAVAEGFAHERVDVQERAVALVTKHLDRARPETRAELALAADALAPSVRMTAGDLLGAVPETGDPGAAAASVELPAPRRTADWPVRGRDLADLAEATAAAIEHLDDPVLLESVLAGIARTRNADRAAFDSAMLPLRQRLPEGDGPPASMRDVALGIAPLGAVLRLLLLEPKPVGRWRAAFDHGRHLRRHPLPEVPMSPGGIAAARMRELAVRLMAGEVADLVAVPTEASGLLDPAVLAERLARLESIGRAPWPCDLQQALLRLPRQVDPGAVDAADRLRSPAGRALASALRTGHVDPQTRLRTGVVTPAQRWMWPAHPTTPVVLADLVGPAYDPAHLATLALDLPDAFGRAGRLTRLQVGLDCALWATAMPSHPEVLAAHALIGMCDLPGASAPAELRQLLATLPTMDGPLGPAVLAAVGYGLGADKAPDRTAAGDAVVALARRGTDGAGLGRLLADMVTDISLKPGRVADGLGDAARVGPDVARLVWQAVAAALPPLLAAGTRDAHRLLGVGADAAAICGARGEVAGLADVAARSGSSKLVTEARRLQQVLAAS